MQISWRYVRDLYDMTLKSEGLTCLPKLRFEHVNLTAFSKMRVDLAAQVRTKQNYYKAFTIIVQVLSSSVSNGIKTFLQRTNNYVSLTTNFTTSLQPSAI